MKGFKFVIPLVFALGLFVSCDNAGSDSGNNDPVVPKDTPVALSADDAAAISADLLTENFSKIFADQDFVSMFGSLLKSDIVKQLTGKYLGEVTDEFDLDDVTDELGGDLDLAKLIEFLNNEKIADLFKGSINFDNLNRAGSDSFEIYKADGLVVTGSMNADPVGLKLDCIMTDYSLQDAGTCSGTMTIVLGLDKKGNIVMICNSVGPLSIENEKLSKEPITIELKDVKIGYALISQPSLDSLVSAISGKPDFDVEGTILVNGKAVDLKKMAEAINIIIAAAGA